MQYIILYTDIVTYYSSAGTGFFPVYYKLNFFTVGSARF
jgi:hypothetical protein